MNKRLVGITLLVFSCFFSQVGLSQADHHSHDEVLTWGIKSKLTGDIMQLSLNFFHEHGFCPPATWLEEEIKLSAQHPDRFGGALHILEMTSSTSDTAQSMSQEERENYIFYYGDNLGVVACEIYQSDLNMQSVISGNIAQLIKVQYDNILNELRHFTTEIENNADPDSTIDKYVACLLTPPNNESRVILEKSFRRALNHLYIDIQNYDADLEAYAYELAHLQAAVLEEFRTLREQKLKRKVSP